MSGDSFPMPEKHGSHANRGKTPASRRPGEGIRYVYRKRRWLAMFRLLDAVGYRFHRPSAGVPELSRARSIVVCKIDQIGDVILTQPLLAALRRAAPRARIELVVGKGRAPIAEAFPEIDSFREFPVRLRPGGVGVHADLRRLASALRKVRSMRPDVVIAAKEDPVTILLARLTGARVRIGFGEGGLGFLLTHVVPVTAGRHQYEVLASLAGREGAAASPPVFPLTDEDRAAAAKILRDLESLGNSGLVLVHPGSGNPATRWPWARFAETMRAVGARHPLTFLVVPPPELGALPPVHLSSPSRVVVLDRPVPLRTLAAFMERADLFLGNESGPSHLAAAVGTPAVIPFLSGNAPQRWGPAGPLGRAVPGRTGVGPAPDRVAEVILEEINRRKRENERPSAKEVPGGTSP